MPNTMERLEQAVVLDSWDFSAKYVAVGELCALAHRHPQAFTRRTVEALGSLLGNAGLSSQSQSFFLYKQTAETLSSLFVHAPDHPNAHDAVEVLRSRLGSEIHPARRAVAESLGALPLRVIGPALPPPSEGEAPLLTWDRLLEAAKVQVSDKPRFAGRSLVTPLVERDELLVVKAARSGDPSEPLALECLWARYFNESEASFSAPFRSPQPVPIGERFLFRLAEFPIPVPDTADIPPRPTAVALLVPKDYFLYPNSPPVPSPRVFAHTILADAQLLGELTAAGIIHEAPIPLFHNRVQRHRRADLGIYEWSQGGRLDRWLTSCAHPNFGPTGIRDFEHLASFDGTSRNLYRHIGNQVLSLLLVAGSYFRNKAPLRRGLSESGAPVDCRDLFDPDLLEELVRGVFLSYYEGFVGEKFPGKIPFDARRISARMVEEMGVDRHMEEFLRVHDQERMTDEEFRAFLTGVGFADEQLGGFTKGAEDIAMITGPHLGGFNQRISLPEILEVIEAASALSILGRFRRCFNGAIEG